MTVEDAVVAGLTPEEYKSFKENIEWWNLEIAKNLEKGDSIEYADLPAIRKMLRRALADKTLQDKQNSHWWNFWSSVE